MAMKSYHKYIFYYHIAEIPERSTYMKIIYANIDILFYFVFIFLIIVFLILKVSKYKRNSKVRNIIKYILAIPIAVLNILILDDLNITLLLFKDENKTDNKK